MTKQLEALIANLKLAIKSATQGQWTFSRNGLNVNVQGMVNLKRGGTARAVLCGLKSSQWRNQLATAHDAAFIALANPENVGALIAALEQSQQRVADLENDEVHQRLANAEEQLRMAELAKYNLKTSRRAQFRKRLAAEKRIAELEANQEKIESISSFSDERLKEIERHRENSLLGNLPADLARELRQTRSRLGNYYSILKRADSAERELSELKKASPLAVKLPVGFVWCVSDATEWIKKEDAVAAIVAAGGTVSEGE